MYTHNLPFASLQNDHLRLDYLTSLGPRVVGLFVNGQNDNLFADTPKMHWPTPHGEYYLYGGHRFWTSPEDTFYMCPEKGLGLMEGENQVILKSPVDASGLEKEIDIKLENNKVHLMHRVSWHGEKQITFAPWALTQMRLGGMAILPFSKVEGLLPDRNIVMWPYSEFKDPRLEMHDDLILVHAYGTGKPFKIGTLNSTGWITYILSDVLLVKRFTTDLKGPYPDRNCNVETYVNDSCIELETIGTLQNLEPGSSLTHTETWEILSGKYPATIDGARDISKQLSQS
jgi:hypothetical protein